MIRDCDEKLLKKFDINQEYLWLYNYFIGKSSGILCGVKRDLYDVGSFQQGKYMLQRIFGIKQKKLKWNFLVIYGAAHEEDKLEFLTELSSFCSRNREPIMIGGDFNNTISDTTMKETSLVDTTSILIPSILSFISMS